MVKPIPNNVIVLIAVSLIHQNIHNLISLIKHLRMRVSNTRNNTPTSNTNSNKPMLSSQGRQVIRRTHITNSIHIKLTNRTILKKRLRLHNKTHFLQIETIITKRQTHLKNRTLTTKTQTLKRLNMTVTISRHD